MRECDLKMFAVKARFNFYSDVLDGGNEHGMKTEMMTTKRMQMKDNICFESRNNIEFF